MRKIDYQCAVLLAIVSVFGGCTPTDGPTDSASVSEQSIAQDRSSDIVFRGRYFLSKECTPERDGAIGMGIFGVCEVVEVLEGDLKLERLIHVHVPADVVEGLVYTFRWKISDSDRYHLRKAQEGGYRGMWLDGLTLELVRGEEPDH